jgi:hypothetical protein
VAVGILVIELEAGGVVLHRRGLRGVRRMM